MMTGDDDSSAGSAGSASGAAAATAAAAAEAEAYEAEHVHAVYESIAPHFSATRHKPWPLVSEFLASQPPGSVGLDVGCGNGKYLSCRDDTEGGSDVVLMGCDRSAALVALARKHVSSSPGAAPAGTKAEAEAEAEAGSGQVQTGREVLVADSLSLPFRLGAADFAISVAVVHHLSTRQRRVDAVAELLRCVRRRGGTVLLYVWALEQASSRRGWDDGADQDQLVPWVMKGEQGREKRKLKQKQQARRKMLQGQQQQQQQQNDGDDEKSSRRRPDLDLELREEDEADGENSPADGADGSKSSQPPADKTFHRFYHLYRRGELEEDIVAAGGKVLRSGYERDNWWAVAENVLSEA